MRDILIRVALPEDMAAVLEHPKGVAMVVPMLEGEVAALRTAVRLTHAFIQLTRRNLSTLRQVLDTKGTAEPEIAATLDMLAKPAAEVAELHDKAMVLIGRGAFVGGGDEEIKGGQMQ